MTAEPSKSSIEITARDILKKFHVLMRESTGANLSARAFFPVNARGIVTGLLSWSIDEVAEIEITGECGRVRGRCLHHEKKILVAVDAISGPGERSFTIAHEIGHAVMHGTVRDREREHDRTRSVRRRNIAREQVQRVSTGLEREADVFAATLLMPSVAVRKRFQEVFGTDTLWSGARILRGGSSQSNVDLPEASRRAAVYQPQSPDPAQDGRSLVEFFGVTPSAMAIRLRELGLIYSGGTVNR